jgi:hypothetical protein
MKNLNHFFYKLGFVLLTITSISLTNSCKKATEKAGEKIIEKSLGKDSKIDIDKDKMTIKTEDGIITSDSNVKSWPNDIPNDVPEFSYGNIINVTTQQTDKASSWSIIFEKLTDNALDQYKTDLEKNGFKINFITTAEIGGQLMAKKDDLNVMVVSSEGNASISIGVEK